MFNSLKYVGKLLTGRTRSLIFTLAALGSLIGLTVTAGANGIRWYISPSDPYIQNWSDTVAISADDDWNNFIAIEGYRGDDLTTGIGVDPQTVLADGETTPLDVIANQSNPNTLATGGVAEFDGIPNPTVALKGSATADAPHLLIRLNKASCPDSKFISVSYKVRDLDSTANDAVQAVALHYRIGTTGNYLNVAGAFVPDATSPNTATRVTNVIGMLPHIPNGLNEIYLRIMTTNAAGNDEWVGIDDINVGCFAATAGAVSLGGRVLSSRGGGLARALVILADHEGNTRTARTNSFGYYNFENVEAGRTYVVSVQSKGDVFESKIVSVHDSIAGLDFQPLE